MNCTTCRAIVDGNMRRCRKCISERALSIGDVKGEYKGWLYCDIIKARSHNTGGNDAVDTDSDGGCVLRGDVCSGNTER